MKKRWFFISLSVALLTLVITGGTLLAQSDGKGGALSSKSMAARVAEKLNEALGLTLQESDVQAAFHESMRDHQEEILQSRLDRLEIEEEDVNSIMDWYQSWSFDSLIRMRPRIGFKSSEAVDRILRYLQEKERITEGQAADIKAWHGARPTLPEELEAYSGRRHRFQKNRGLHSTDEAATERARPFDRQPGDSFSRPGRRQDGAGNFSTDGAIERLLNRLLEQEQITQAEKDEISAWITDKPDIGPNVGRWIFLGEGLLKQRLDRMVGNGRIEQGDADDFLNWFRDRPAGIQALNQFLGRHGRQPTDRPSDSQSRPSGQNRGDRFDGPELRRQDSPGDLRAPALQDSL